MEGNHFPVQKTQNPADRSNKEKPRLFPAHTLGKLQFSQKAGDSAAKEIEGRLAWNVLLEPQVFSSFCFNRLDPFKRHLVLVRKAMGCLGGLALRIERRRNWRTGDCLAPIR